MYYAKIENNTFLRRVNVADEAPGVVFVTDPTAEELAPYNVVIVNDAQTIPEFDPATQGLVDIDPTVSDDGKWYANYQVITLPVEPTPE
jgi:hypothetical protein